MKKHNKLTNLITATLLAGMLSAGVAGAQSTPTVQIRPATSIIQRKPIDFFRPALPRPVVINRPGSNQAWPAAAAAVAAVVSAAVEVVHRVTESWMPSRLDRVGRSGLVSIGAYDR